jgi:two-component system cell cycle sensor histidine kinase/response regulator CckA
MDHVRAVLICSEGEDEAGAVAALQRAMPGLEVAVIRRETGVDAEVRPRRAGPVATELTRRELQAEAVAALGQAALAGAPLEEVLDHACHIVARFLGCERVTHVADEAAARTKLPPGAVVIPLSAGDGTMGALIAERPGRPEVHRDDMRFAVSIANIASAAGERVRSEAALRASEEQFRLLAESIREVFWMARTEDVGDTFYVNAAYEEIWQRPRQGISVNPRDWLEGVHPDDRARVLEWTNTSRSTDGVATEYRVVRPDGTVRWIRDRAFHVRDASGNTRAIAGLAMDITAEHQLTRRLAAHQAVTRILAEAGDPVAAMPRLLDALGSTLEMRTGAAWTADAERGVLRCAQVWPARPGSGAPATLARGEGLPGGAWAARAARWEAGLNSGCAFPIRKGEEVWGVFEFHQDYRRELDPELMRLLDALGEQIGEYINRTRVEQAHAQLAAVIEATPEFVGLASRDGKPIYVNLAGRRLFGLPEEAPARDLPMRSTWTAEQWQVFERDALPVVFEKGVWQGETRRRNLAGEEIPLWQVIVGHRGADGEVEYVSTIGRDLRERHRLEDQLRQAQKMEAIGRLAGGVAHDFNNLLSVILGHLDLALDDPAGPHASPETLAIIQRAAERASGLTRQLLAFSRKQVLQPRRVEMNEIVAETVKMLPRILGENVRVETELAHDLPPVRADAGQLAQVVMNLVVNAREAMPRGGVVTLRTRVAPAGPPPAEGEQVVLSVLDTGSGVAPAIRERLFEPFFTTKGRGTGLGLSTVYGIVKQSGGEIELESELGAGTAFHIYLPSHRGEDPSPPALAPFTPGAAFESILVVEDQEDLRLLASAVLRRRGYRVLEAASLPTALEVARTAPGAIDLILADVVLADGSGPQVVELLRRERPHLKVLYMSGYTDDTILRYGIESGRMPIIEKPFTASELERKVRETLDARA